MVHKVTLKKGAESWDREIHDESGVAVGKTYVIGGEPWVVDKVHGNEPEKPDPLGDSMRLSREKLAAEFFNKPKPDLIEQPKPQPKPEPKPVERPKAPQAKHHTPVKKSHRR